MQIPLTKQALAESFKQLLRRRSFHSITVTDICENAGVSRRNFYRHFSDKYEVLSWIYDYEFCSAVRGEEDWVMQDHFYLICNFLYQDRDFYKRAFAVEGQNSFREFCRQQLHPLFVKDFKEVLKNKDLEEFFIRHMSDMIFDALILWLQSENPMPPEEYAQYFNETLNQIACKIGKNYKIWKSHEE